MKILVMNQLPRRLANYPKWLNEIPHEDIYFITAKKYAQDFPEFSNVIAFENFNDNYLLEKTVIELHKSVQFTRIIALDEFDILRAAQLREYLNIPGQSVASAMAFRDKVTMKEVAKSNGIKIPTFKAIHHFYDVYDFIKEHDYPVVIKPRSGAGSRKVVVIQNDTQFHEFVSQGIPFDSQVETYIEGNMYSIDGLVKDYGLHFMSVSQYINDPLCHQEDKSFAFALIGTEHKLYQRMKKFINELLLKFPTPEFCSFHCEVFHTLEDELILCEIASRTGGADIGKAISISYGIDLDESWVRLECGLEIEPLKDTNPEYLCGGMTLKTKPAILKFLPEEIPFDWITHYYRRGIPGKTYLPADSYIESIGSFLVKGNTQQQIEGNVYHTHQWLIQNIQWIE
ncbi:hypothetical protein CQZ94_28420 [Bacillus sp. MYb209]|uniref:ATP-grasp domain-containing protein n=1 Tax=Bacillus sp. MYb209 TaxID=1848605 RepID=UPI000CFD2658|nr:ATP-grasp domain-containing protein [Bacillus sp. MYb209]PQZ47919.1 hypothetical protein CQZ94_28420 [Bacillus sp. MYb209]